MTVPKSPRSKKRQRMPNSTIIPLLFVALAFTVIVALIWEPSQRSSASLDATMIHNPKSNTESSSLTGPWRGETVPIPPPKASSSNPSASLSPPALSMPAIGYGTCCRPTAKGDAIYESTLLFINRGGRLIDTAMAYGNHREIGRAVRDSGVPREHLWITSKIAVGRIRGEEATLEAVSGILREIGTDYLDLCLIHSPKRGREETIEIWRGLVKARDERGLVRSIGASNFNRAEIVDLTDSTGVEPQVHQIQFHPWTPDEWKDLVRWQKGRGIATTAYTSLGGSRFHSASVGGYSWPPVLIELAKRHGATEAQVLLRWALNQGVAVIPGATSDGHIRENLSVPIFELNPEELEQLERAGAPQGWWDGKRGPVKFKSDEADMERAWTGDHTTKGK